MKIGLAIPQYARWFRGEPALRVLTTAREMSLQSIWLVDHIVPHTHAGRGLRNRDHGRVDGVVLLRRVCNAIDYHPYSARPWR